MSDDLIERLRECAECKSSEAWGRLDGGQDLCIGAALANEAADELSRLRSDVERLTASLSAEVTESEKLRSIIKQQAETIEYERALNAAEFEVLDSPFKQRAEEAEAALSDERRHADALAELVADQIETESEFWTEWDEQAAQAMQQHRARRQG